MPSLPEQQPGTEQPEQEVRRCAAHGLVAAPDGKCVVCRRSSLPIALEPAVAPSQPLAGRVLTWLLAVLASASLGALITLRTLEASDAERARTLAIQSSARALPVAQRTGPRALTPATASAQPPEAPATATPLRTRVPVPNQAGATQPPTPPSPTLNDALQQQRAQLAAQADEQRHKQIEADLNVRALAAARRNVAIEMYSTSWCGVCSAARSYMQAQQIAFTDHDIDRDELAKERARKLNPRLSVPVIDVGGYVMIGFSEKKLEENIDQAAHKRIGL